MTSETLSNLQPVARLVLLGGLLLSAANCAPVDRCEGTPANRELALVASQPFAAELLRAPGSAQFPSSLSERGVIVASTGPCEFQVASWVDSHNGFGALIRSRYFATMKPVAAGEYQATDVWIGD